MGWMTAESQLVEAVFVTRENRVYEEIEIFLSLWKCISHVSQISGGLC